MPAALGGGGAALRGALATNEHLEARPCVVRTRRGWATMLLDRDAPGDRKIVRFERLTERL